MNLFAIGLFAFTAGQLLGHIFYYGIKPLIDGYFNKKEAWRVGYEQGAQSVEHAKLVLAQHGNNVRAFVQIEAICPPQYLN